MKRTKIFIFAFCAIITPIIISTASSSAPASTIIDNGREVEYGEHDLKYNTQNESPYINAFDFQNKIISFFNMNYQVKEEFKNNKEDELDLKHKEFVAEEEEKNRRDIQAYKILTKYYGDEYKKNSLISDLNEDLTIMLKMEELLKSDLVDKDEAYILSSYVLRRLDMIENPNIIDRFKDIVNNL